MIRNCERYILKNKTNKCYFLSRIQLEVLLNRLGYKNVYNVEMGDDFNKISSEEEYQRKIYTDIAELVKNKILNIEENGLIINNDIREILTYLGNAELFLKILVNYEKFQEYMCYITEEHVVITSISQIRKNKISITCIENKDFYENFLLPNLPELLHRQIDDDDIKLTNFEQMITNDFKNGIVNSEIMLYMEIRNKEKIIKEIFGLDYNSQNYLFIKEKDFMSRTSYDEKIIYELISEYFENVATLSNG